MEAKVYQLRPETPDREPDAALVRRAQAGDASAFDALYRRSLSNVRGMAFMLSASGEDLEDAVQETFVAVLDGLPKLEDPQAYSAWLGRITIRATQRVLRRRYRRERFGLVARLDVDADAFVSTAAPPDVAVELRRLYGAIGRLPPEERVALLLRRVAEYSNDEVAAALGVSLATAKRRIQKAAARLEARR